MILTFLALACYTFLAFVCYTIILAYFIEDDQDPQFLVAIMWAGLFLALVWPLPIMVMVAALLIAHVLRYMVKEDE